MAKRERRIIKRIYEEGREETVSRRPKKRSLAGKKIPQKSPSYVTAWAQPAAQKPYKETTREIKPEHKVLHAPVAEKERKPFVDGYELPATYDTTRLTLMPKDPFWVFAYWEIAQRSIDSVRNIVSNEDVNASKLVLRMYDVTFVEFDGGNANRYFDIEVGPNATNWYVSLWSDNVSYVGDIGLKVPDGRFFTLARSNFIHTPRVRYSPRTEQIWMKVTDEKYTRPYVVSREAGEGRFAERYTKPSGPSVKVKALSDTKKGRVFYLNESDIRQYYGRLNPLLREIINARLSRRYGRKPGDIDLFLLEGETEEERTRLLRLLPKGYFLKRLLVGSSQELVITQGASEALQGGASGFQQEKPHKFFFELNTELIVYGRTEPDALVELGNQKIDLRQDGTFSMRFALPDGKIPLEFTATSKDKLEKRKINTYVTRNTVREN